MDTDKTGIGMVNSILDKTIESLNHSKNELFEIVDHSKKEHTRLEEEFKKIQVKVQQTIKEVERLEIIDRISRNNLSKKNGNFQNYTEVELKDAYKQANIARINLEIKRQEEKNLIEKRNDLEQRLKSSQDVYKKASNINKQLDLVSSYLKGSLDDVSKALDDITEKQYLGFRIINILEEEKHMLAREIHDGPAQSIANITLKAEFCERLLEKNKEGLGDELVNLKNISRSTLKELRRTIYELRPMSLDDLGLVPTISKYVDNFNRDTGILIDLKLIGDLSVIDMTVQVAIFRIVQEALNNIRKHSKASEGSVVLEKSANSLNIKIEDNGIGFDTENQNKERTYLEGGFGLVSIRERVDLLNGKLIISSTINQGTKLIALIPLKEEEEDI